MKIITIEILYIIYIYVQIRKQIVGKYQYFLLKTEEMKVRDKRKYIQSV